MSHKLPEIAHTTRQTVELSSANGAKVMYAGNVSLKDGQITRGLIIAVGKREVIVTAAVLRDMLGLARDDGWVNL